MGTHATRNLPARLERTRRRFEQWRRARQGRSRIPEPLWALAVKAASRYGLNQTSRTLRLDYYTLKKRAETASGRPVSEGEGTTAFVELPSPPPTDSPECLLELEGPGGAKMRVHLKGMPAPDLAALSRVFWSMQG